MVMQVNPRWIPTTDQLDGITVAHSAATPESFKLRAALLVPPRKMIPVIFIPGIMGSNLRVKSSHEGLVRREYERADTKYTPQSWRPDNGKRLLLRMHNAPPALRQVVLCKDTTEVDDALGDIDVDGLNLSIQEARIRGWGQVMWSSYGPMIKNLERDLGRFMFPPSRPGGDRTPTPWWEQMLGASDRGPIPSNFKVYERWLRKAASFQFPVYVCGYNWLESNAQSAKRLKKVIEATIMRYADAKGPDGKPAYECKQVIIVTHSMGGLVGRMASKLLKNEGKEDKILGIIHGEMPATGAPVAYRRMACGTEGSGIEGNAFAAIVGSTAPEVTPIFAFSPGALQLAPTPDYPSPWLIAEIEKNGTKKRVLSLPAHGDPYGEIFIQRGKWFCPAREEWLDPAGLHIKKNRSIAWSDYCLTVKIAKKFHTGNDPKESLGHYYHPNTYAHYGDDPKQQSFKIIHWKGEPATPTTPEVPEGFFRDAPMKVSDGMALRAIDLGKPDPTLQGWIEYGSPGAPPVNALQAFYCQSLGEIGESGDGTVPAPSGAAPGRHGVSRIYQLKGFDHQNSYKHEAAIGATFFAILDMVKDLEPDPVPVMTAGR